MKRVIFNQKGGVGKTSIACNLAAAFARLGRKVLLIDLDAQCNASQYILGDKFHTDLKNIATFWESTLSFKFFNESLRETVIASPFKNLWVIPGSGKLAEIQPKLESRYKIFKLSQALDALLEKRRFDEIIIDTPPALNFYSMSSLISADRVLIPFDCDEFSAKAVLQVMDVVEEVASDHKPNLKTEGVVINNFQAKAKLPISTVQDLLSQGLNVITPYLSNSVIMKESHSKNKPLVFLRPNHKLSQEFIELSERLLSSKQKNINKAKVTKNKKEKTLDSMG